MCRYRPLCISKSCKTALAAVYTRQRGSSLTETLIALVLSSYIIAGVTGFYVGFKTSVLNEQDSMQMASGLRIGMSRISEKLRNSAWGVPAANLPSWVPWVSGVTTNPTVIKGGPGAPDTLLVVECTMKPVTTLALSANKGDMALNVADASMLDTATKRLILLDGTEHVHIVGATGTTLLIDTDPMVTGQQGLARAYPAGTPVYRLDVLTIAVDTDANKLMLDSHDGTNPKTLLNGISNLQIVELVAGKKYQVVLTAKTDTLDLETGNYGSRSIRSDVTTRR